MRTTPKIDAYLTEADAYIDRAEALLQDLEPMSASEARIMRANLYLAALRRLRRLIDTHRLRAEQVAVPSSVAAQAGPKRPRWRLIARGDPASASERTEHGHAGDAAQNAAQNTSQSVPQEVARLTGTGPDARPPARAAFRGAGWLGGRASGA